MLEDLPQKFEKITTKFKTEIAGLRTGRATSMLVENIQISCYNTKMALKEVASISVPDAKMILIEPWDKTILADIEKSIQSSNLGFTPSNDGATIRIVLPPLTAERRTQLVKALHSKQEETMIEIRKVREAERNEIKNAEKNDEISEDEKFRLDKKLQDTVDKENELIKKITEEKENEITTV